MELLRRKELLLQGLDGKLGRIGSSDVELDFRLDVNVPVWAPSKREKRRLSPMRKSLRGNRRNSSLVNLRSDSVNGWHLSAFYLAGAMSTIYLEFYLLQIGNCIDTQGKYT